MQDAFPHLLLEEELVLLTPNPAWHGDAPEQGESACADGCSSSSRLRPSGPEPNFTRRYGQTRGNPGNEPRGRKVSYRLPPRCMSSGCWVGPLLCLGGRSFPGSSVLPPLVASPRVSGPPRLGAGCPRRPPALGWFHGWT